ncbi:hypothetical protein B6D06_11365 [Gilliamella apis]|uniref:DUF6862 domain-containing protein n=1 Tax=Gilliamella apis TaxID=1970738 RepID=A0A242NRQ0_9GAMM|nr:hypothetical protein B6D06_11365 [Gilliamella apis]
MWGSYHFLNISKIGGKIIKVETKSGLSLIKEAENAYKAGDITKGNQLMNQAVSHGTEVETTVIRLAHSSNAGKGTTEQVTTNNLGSSAHNAANYEKLKLVENNYLSVNEAKRKAYLTWIKPNYLGEELTEDEKKELENLNKLDKERDQILQDNCSLGNISSSACKGLLQEAWEMQNEYEKEVARSLTNADLYREDSKNLNEALVGLDPNSIIHLISIEAIAKETGRDVKDVAQQYKYVMAAHGIVSSLAGLYGGVNFTQPNTNIGKPGNIVNKVDDIAVKGSIPEIKGTQVGLRDPAQIDLMKSDMLNGSFEFTATRGKIAGYIDSKGNYYITEGHHRMAAAQEIYKTTGDATYIHKLLENGKWDKTNKVPVDALPLPTRKP